MESRVKIEPGTPILGVDIGGTKIAVVCGDVSGKIHDRRQFAAEVERGPDDAMDRIRDALDALRVPKVPPHPVIGISCAGPLSSTEGRLLNPPNMPGWHDYPISEELERRTGKTVRLMNDANAAAYAEWRFGSGRGTGTLVFFTMSTGMGAGLVINGRLHEGPDDLAGEVGHTRIAADGPVGFGRRGSLEGFCSGPGIQQLAVAALHRARQLGEDSELAQSDRDDRLVSMEEIGIAARNGDALALGIFEEVGDRLGTYVAGLVDLLNPEVVALGTIGRLFFDLIEPTMRARIDDLVHPRAAKRLRLRPAELGSSTGDLAAIAAAMTQSE